MELDQEEAAREEIDRLAEFFDIDMDYPEFDTTWTIPRGQSNEHGEEYSVLKTNPWIPWGGKHESRHMAHCQVIEDVAKRNPDAVRRFYDEQLDSLEPRTSFYTAAVNLMQVLTSEKDADRMYQEFLEGSDKIDLSDVVFSKNAETNLQPEVFAHDSRGEITLSFGGTSGIWGVNFWKNADDLEHSDLYDPGFWSELGFQGFPEYSAQSPEAALIAGASLTAGYILGRDAYSVSRAEPLTESNLEGYSPEDRKRAMLYNSGLEKDIDSFLSVLDEYGIE